MKKILLATSVVLARVSSAFALTDIADSDFKVYIENAQKEHIISGYDDNTFRPNNPVSFIESLKIIINTGPARQELGKQTATMNFANWYDPFVYFYNKNQKTNEVNFENNEKITRDFAVYLMLRQLGITLNKSDYYLISLDKDFPDLYSYTPLAPYIRFAKYAKITDGYSDGTFGPKNKVTRGELTKMVWRSLRENKEDILKKYSEIQKLRKLNSAEYQKPTVQKPTIKKENPIKKTPVSTANQISSTNEWLKIHNSLRKLHGVPALTWSKKLEESARSYAKKCQRKHSTNEYGENISFANFVRTPREIVQGWYDEKRFYDFARGEVTRKNGHFTQVVWKDTKEIGCATVDTCGGKYPYMTVCQYFPAGNYAGEFLENVLPLR
ncbi:S-layer homology domain-containing protein [Candidatus Gracilibacteria bacterium]|nr:S-layer homology domain-containing protein [Candidatus Gracilibacteria bacterium]